MTEANWDLSAAREDMPSGIGVVGDVVAITPTTAQTAAIGVSGKWAPSDHRHPLTVVASANPHGFADHTDLTRGILHLIPDDATLDVATLATVGSVPNAIRAINYADAATQGAYWMFPVPLDWASGPILVQPLWSPSATDATPHTVRWQMTVKDLTGASDVTAAGTTTTWTGDNSARTVNLLVYETAVSTTITPAATGDLIKIEVLRLGADAADTYVGAVRLHALIITYTASQ